MTAATVASAKRSPSRRQAAITALIYFGYFLLSIAGQATHSTPLSLFGTAWYFIVAVALWRLFAPADRRVAVAVLPLAALGCVVQGVGQIQSDTGLQTAAIAYFGLFEIVLGYLIARSRGVPRWLGVALAMAGAAGLAVVVADIPTTIRFAAVALGGLSELALLIWLIVRAVRG
jgi:hypothetical protein